MRQRTTMHCRNYKFDHMVIHISENLRMSYKTKVKLNRILNNASEKFTGKILINIY